MTRNHKETTGSWTLTESLEIFCENLGILNNMNTSEIIFFCYKYFCHKTVLVVLLSMLAVVF